MRSGKGVKELQEKLAMELPAFERWRLNAFALKESQNTKSGSVYKDVFVFPLGSK